MEIKKIGIVGQGALGVMYGNYLKKRMGNENVFFIADERRVNATGARIWSATGKPVDFPTVSGGGGDGGSHYLCGEVHGNGERA